VSAGDHVNLLEDHTPADYHCTCEYCRKVIGELRPNEREHYSRLERREYYAPEEKRKEDGTGHIAKTPLHVARWAVQQYTRPGDWVLDPTIGAGTTAVEALTQGRSIAGMELEYGSVLKANITCALGNYNARQYATKVKVAQGDARNIKTFLDGAGMPDHYQLVVNNPPYSGDVSAYPKRDKEGRVTENAQYLYDKTLPNLAFLKENDEYLDTLHTIWQECAAHLAPGGHFVIAVKDMVRGGQPYLLHKILCELLEDSMGLEFSGTAFLRHHPGTWYLNTNKTAPQYQTINVFRKTIAAAPTVRRTTSA
jgi:DNA modification methylase